MRHSEKKSYGLFWLAIITPLVLIVPNILLDITETQINWVGKIMNIIFPLSFYVILLGVFKKTGWGVVLSLPFMILGAFQIVLLYLFGDSIIAVDMFLNVATTDKEEAGTLLQNLTPSIIFVVILYLPILIWSIFSIINKRILKHYLRLIVLGLGIASFLVTGILFLVLSLCKVIIPRDDIFPINVISNVFEAFRRSDLSRNYELTSAEFKYDAVYTDSVPRIVALVIGETARPDRWELFGAERKTNPLLTKKDNIYIYPKSITQSNTTHKSVPMMISPTHAENFDSLIYVKSMITAFKEAGFETAWISNQPPNGSYTEKMGNEADTVIYDKYVLDVKLAEIAENVLKTRSKDKNQLLIFHTYGTHFPYTERYRGTEPTFIPDAPMEAKKTNREYLLNAYDNTVIATDLALDSIINVISRFNDNAVLVYAADHGEDIFDDEREKFLHASPSPTAYQLMVPMLVWGSDSFLEKNNLTNILKENSNKTVSPSLSVFHSVIELGGLDTPFLESSFSIASKNYFEPELIYLTDRNEAAILNQKFLDERDVETLKNKKFKF